MISKFYLFLGDTAAQQAKMRELRNNISGNIRQTPMGLTIAAFHEDQNDVEHAKSFGLTECPIGSMKWRYYFELAREHLIDVIPVQKVEVELYNDVIDMIGKKAGKRATLVEENMYSVSGNGETPFEFMTRMNTALDVKDGVFYHRAKAFKFAKTGMDE